MKLFDRYKISLHNIKNNKSRSILTTVIVYIISLLIMTILCIGISFATNMSAVIKDYYQKSSEPIEVSYYLYRGDNSNATYFDKDVYTSLDPYLLEHQSIISYLKYSVNSYISDSYIGDHRFSPNSYYEIIEGDNVTKEDSATNAILVSSGFVNEYYINTGVKLLPGDTITYEYRYNIPGNEEYSYIEKIKELEFKIKGIYKSKDVEQENYYSPFSASTKFIVDVQFLFNNIETLHIESAYYYYDVTKTNFNSDELTNKLQAFVDDLNDILPKNEYGNGAYSNALSDLKMSSIIGLVIIGVASFLCFVLILLSIGSLANTIMISVDKNKKFIGLLKALGLNEKDLKSTIKLESITTIVLGITLSFLTIYMFSDLLANLNTLLIGSMFSHYISETHYVPVFSLPIYVPIIVLFFFVAFTLLFARGSMSKIAKTDPMAVISEVA